MLRLLCGNKLIQRSTIGNSGVIPYSCNECGKAIGVHVFWKTRFHSEEKFYKYVSEPSSMPFSSLDSRI